MRMGTYTGSMTAPAMTMRKAAYKSISEPLLGLLSFLPLSKAINSANMCIAAVDAYDIAVATAAVASQV